ncbi:hypothetical protein JOD82_001763 [Paenibacillus sp. 1182]|nr:hypothetical protein [Paenibacillus sp. 1182]
MKATSLPVRSSMRRTFAKYKIIRRCTFFAIGFILYFLFHDVVGF